MDQWQVDDSDFTQFVEEVPHDMEGDCNENPDFILESEHNSKSEQSASDNDLELVAGRNY
jgi:hypothetical protein